VKLDRWQKIEEIFAAALEQPEEKHAAFLKQACGEDEELRREVESMLEARRAAGSFLGQPAAEQLGLAPEGKQEKASLVGKRLGVYEIEELIGKGGMGEVYKAQDARLERRVAIKILQPQLMTDVEHLKRFRREAKAASALNHPNIATIHDVGEAEGLHYLVMEFVTGQTLAEKLKKGPLEVQEVLKIGIQATEALEAAHKNGIVHRDIKPANLMITPEGRLKVLDFGLAKQARQGGMGQSTVSQTTPGIVMGTVEYMSPEQVLGHEVDHRTDLFSLGVTIYELVAGRLPFQGTTPTETMDRILHQEPESLTQSNEKLPVGLEQIVRKCLEKDRNLCYQTASDLCADLKRLKRDTEEVELAVAAPQSRQRQYITVLAIFIGAVALAVAGWLWLNRPGPRMDETQLTAVPLTSYPGSELWPSFSPDGNQVAFAWNGEKQDNRDIYIKQIGVEAPYRLTNDPAADGHPAWSPDGKFIAFCRLQKSELFLIIIPQRGGPERLLGKINLSGKVIMDFGHFLTWTPDSKWLVFSRVEEGEQVWALYMLAIETGEMRQLTNPPGNVNGDTSPAFSPDGQTLAFGRVFHGTYACDLYRLRLGNDYHPQGEPQRVALKNSFNTEMAWMPDAQELIFRSGDYYNFGLWKMKGFNAESLQRLPFAGNDASSPAVSQQGNRLAYVVSRDDSNILRLDFEEKGQKFGPAYPFISSTRFDHFPAYSPDGRRIAFSSQRSGSEEIWVCDSDGSNLEKLTSFGGPLVYGPRWSWDGLNIAFTAASQQGKEDIYIIGANGGVPHRLMNHPAVNKWPFWSHDGKWIYFCSQLSGQDEIWKIPVGGGDPVQITRNFGDVPQESPDGKFIFYCKLHTNVGIRSLWKMPVEGGDETRVLESIYHGASWAIHKEGIYFFSIRDRQGRRDLSFYDFPTGGTRKILTVEKKPDLGICISPDGKTILYSELDESGSDLMLVENFK
jgi:serine/threonine protein kinase/Tol biopolymer transport system component